MSPTPIPPPPDQDDPNDGDDRKDGLLDRVRDRAEFSPKIALVVVVLFLGIPVAAYFANWSSPDNTEIAFTVRNQADQRFSWAITALADNASDPYDGGTVMDDLATGRLEAGKSETQTVDVTISGRNISTVDLQDGHDRMVPWNGSYKITVWYDDESRSEDYDDLTPDEIRPCGAPCPRLVEEICITENGKTWCD